MDINIVRSHAVTNSFYFVYNAGKAVLFPFIPLYFRFLGFSATQTGILVGLTVFCLTLLAPLWTTCAVSCNKRHAVLMFSLLATMAGGLTLTLVPPVGNTYHQSFECAAAVDGNGTSLSTIQDSPVTELLHTPINTLLSTSSPSAAGTNGLWNSVSTNSQSATASPGLWGSISTSSPGRTGTPGLWDSLSEELRQRLIQNGLTEDDLKSIGMDELQQALAGLYDSWINSTALRTSTLPSINVNSVVSSEPVNIWDQLPQQSRDELVNLGYNQEELSSMDWESFEQLMKDVKDAQDNSLWQYLDSDTQSKLFEVGLSKDISALSVDDALELMKNLKKEEEKMKLGHRRKREIDAMSTTLSSWVPEVSHAFSRSFIFVLGVLTLAALVGAPVERLADKMWFDFLDALDLVERYETHKVWAALGFVLVPAVVTVAVSYAPCTLILDIPRINLHFYVFAGFMGLSLVVAFFLPSVQDRKHPARKTKLCKGLRILFADARSFSFTCTVFLLALLTPIINNFLFWKVQDLHGSEMTMGAAVSVGALFELVMLMILKWFVGKLGHPAAVFISIIVLAMRLGAYSFIWLPWLVIVVSPLHCFSHTLLWGAVEQYPEFRVNPYLMDRSAVSVMKVMYLGCGYAVGSMLSGCLYDLVGFDTTCRFAAILVLSWCVVFVLVQWCCKKKQTVWYSRLLAEDEPLTDDESDTETDDDWLKSALNGSPTNSTSYPMRQRPK